MFQNKSLRSSERGLKSIYKDIFIHRVEVAPFVGAWIEIFCTSSRYTTTILSLRSSERGLK